MAEPLLIAKNDRHRTRACCPALANRHGLIAGATGTGKTVTLQVLAEASQRIGVPVFMADVKGDLSGLAAPGARNRRSCRSALEQLGLDEPTFAACPVAFWDVFGEQGHPVRATVSEMGPLLLGRMLNLNDTQQGVLTLVFKIADDNGLLLLDLKDLRAMLQHVGRQRRRSSSTEYGNISAASDRRDPARPARSSSSRAAEQFFGEPALDIDDLMQTDGKGRGVINILAADKLMNSPKLYATFLLWLLSELFEQLPEVGDPDKPKLVFFFDEAHLLFNDAPEGAAGEDRAGGAADPLQGRRRVLRHPEPARHARTPCSASSATACSTRCAPSRPRDQKAVKTAATTLRANPKLDIETGDHRARRRRGAGLVPRREGPAERRRARLRPAAAHRRSGRSRRRSARRSSSRSLDRRPLREGGRPRVGLREAAGRGRRAGTADRRRQAAPAAPGRAAA